MRSWGPVGESAGIPGKEKGESGLAEMGGAVWLGAHKGGMRRATPKVPVFRVLGVQGRGSGGG